MDAVVLLGGPGSAGDDAVCFLLVLVLVLVDLVLVVHVLHVAGQASATVCSGRVLPSWSRVKGTTACRSVQFPASRGHSAGSATPSQIWVVVVAAEVAVAVLAAVAALPALAVAVVFSGKGVLTGVPTAVGADGMPRSGTGCGWQRGAENK